MSNLKLIIEREYTTRVKKKSFLLLTILVPLIFVGFMFSVMYFSLEETKQVKVLVVDPGQWCGTDIFQENSETAPAQFFFFEQYIGEVKTFVEHEKFKDYDVMINLNEKVPANRMVPIFYKKNLSLKTKEYIQNRIEARIREYFALKKTRLTLAEYNMIQLPFDFKFKDAHNPQGEDLTTENAMVGFGFSILTFFFIFFYSNQVMRGVIEEKTNRVVEVIISSVRPFQLMMGKIIGIGLVGLTQFLIWVLISGAGLLVLRAFVFQDVVDPSNWDAEAMDSQIMVTEGLQGINKTIAFIYGFPWLGFIATFLVYFVGGFLIYSSLFAMIGAMVDSETDTQQLILPVTLPLLLGYMVAAMMISNPESHLGTVFSLIPLTSPVVIVIKAAVGSAGPLLLTCSIILLILTFLGTTWMAAKIYRTGILMYGKKASWKEVIKWLRYK